jgi:hypothetical protein
MIAPVLLGVVASAATGLLTGLAMLSAAALYSRPDRAEPVPSWLNLG